VQESAFSSINRTGFRFIPTCLDPLRFRSTGTGNKRATSRLNKHGSGSRSRKQLLVSHMKIASVASALPQNYYSQADITAALKEHWESDFCRPATIDRLHSRMGVEGRALSLPLDAYREERSWGVTNSIWIQAAQALGETAIRRALAETRLPHDRLGAFFFVSVTGIASPSIDARLVNRMRLPKSIKRVPIFGLGCVAGAAGIARAADYVKAHPDEAAVLLSVELCSLTWQRRDLSPANVISSGLFGDGAAAVIMAGRHLHCAGPEVVATRSIFYPDSGELMGWQISEAGFRIVLSPDVPKIILENLEADVDEFLWDQGLGKSDIGTWIMHTGGPKVLKAIEASLQLPKDALAVSWESLREQGNLSSASVLLVLERFMKDRRPQAGSYSLLAAMGPGFCAELVLIRW
jgi:alkylresorcinol/alkylpyrone synthase